MLENILFGKKYDEERLQRVIRSCSLEQDLAILPQGKHTEIGEKGITLSGRCTLLSQNSRTGSIAFTGGQKVGIRSLLCWFTLSHL
jgi:hypothetical protein